MHIKNVWYRGHSRYSFHGCDPAEILGIKMITLVPSGPRLCLHVKYSNGDEDYAPLAEAIDNGYISDETPERIRPQED